MSVFDCDEYLAALEKPSVKVNGRIYEGRILSIVEFLPYAEPFQRAIKAAQEGKMDVFMAFAEDYLYAVFPKSNAPFWRPDLKTDDIVPELMKQPGVFHMILDFFVLQGKAIGHNPLTPHTTTNGINSPDNPLVDTSTPIETPS